MITSSSNSRIKNVIQLTGKAKARKEQHSFVVEGVKMFLEAPNERIKEIYVSERLLKKACLKRENYLKSFRKWNMK